MTIVHFGERPEDAELVVVDGKTTAYFRENIQEEQITTPEEEGPQIQWSAEEYALSMTVTANVRERFEANKETWWALAKERDYDQAAKEIRELRNRLLEQTDKEMSIDRIVSDIPEAPGNISAFLPFLKSLIGSLTGAMARYRQALRDVPQQEGFPYHVVWPEAPHE